MSRTKILDAGLEILDSYGLADLTMRRLATRLGVAPGALYWHFANKQTLIESIARRILDPMLPEGDSSTRDWPEASHGDREATPGAPESAAHWCTRLRAALLRRRDGAELVGAAVAMTSLHGELLTELETRLAADTDRSVGAATLLHFVLGSTVLEQSARQAAAATGTTPADTVGETGQPSPATTEFDRGIEIILTGLSGAGTSGN